MKQVKCLGMLLLIFLANGPLNPLYAVDEQRQAYDKMVEEATHEADEYVERKQTEHKQAAKKRKGEMDTTFDERVRTERERLEAEIDKVGKRGLDPNFTEGMRQNRLQELGDKLDQLDGDPQAYFGE